MLKHDQRDWDAIAKDLRFVRDHSQLKPPEIYRKLRIPRSQFSIIVNRAGCGLRPEKRRILTDLVNSTKEKLGQKPGPKQLSFEFDVGQQVDLASASLNINVTRRTETVWMVEVRVTEKVVK
jgi:hypothetical protein